MDEETLLDAAKLIKARRGLDRLINAVSDRKSWLVELGTAPDGGEIYDSNVMIPADVVTLGLRQMVEELTRQIRALNVS